MKQTTYLIAVSMISTLLHAQSIPNGDFEHWTTFNFFEPTGWLSSNTETIHTNNWITVLPVDGHDGVGHAIRMSTDGQNGRVMPGYFSNTSVDPRSFCEEQVSSKMVDGKPFTDVFVMGVCVELKNNTCPKKHVWSAIALLPGVKSGLLFGMK
jgi:hypothetical protein